MVVGMVPSTPPILPPQRSMTRVTAMATTAERTASSTAVSTVSPPASPKRGPTPRHRARAPGVSRAQRHNRWKQVEVRKEGVVANGFSCLIVEVNEHTTAVFTRPSSGSHGQIGNARSRSSQSGAAPEEHRGLQRPRPPQARARAHPQQSDRCSRSAQCQCGGSRALGLHRRRHSIRLIQPSPISVRMRLMCSSR